MHFLEAKTWNWDRLENGGKLHGLASAFVWKAS
jgi:hypothetical protein